MNCAHAPKRAHGPVYADTHLDGATSLRPARRENKAYTLGLGPWCEDAVARAVMPTYTGFAGHPIRAVAHARAGMAVSVRTAGGRCHPPTHPGTHSLRGSPAHITAEGSCLSVRGANDSLRHEFRLFHRTPGTIHSLRGSPAAAWKADTLVPRASLTRAGGISSPMGGCKSNMGLAGVVPGPQDTVYPSALATNPVAYSGGVTVKTPGVATPGV